MRSNYLTIGGGYSSYHQTERRQGTVLTCLRGLSVEGGLRRNRGGDPRG